MKSRSFKHHFKFLCVTLLALFLLACGGSKGEEQARRYQLKGTIISVDQPHKQVVIAHEAIAGLMEAMTMPYTLKDDSAFAVMRPGDKIQATLAVTTNRSWLEDPIITQTPQAIAGAPAPVASAEPQLGASVPNFTLTNQDGKQITLQQ